MDRELPIASRAVEDRVVAKYQEIDKQRMLNIKASVDNKAPRKYPHISTQTGKGQMMKRMRQDLINKDNKLMFDRLVDIIEHKGVYHQDVVASKHRVGGSLATQDASQPGKLLMNKSRRKTLEEEEAATLWVMALHADDPAKAANTDLRCTINPTRRIPVPNTRAVYTRENQMELFRSTRQAAAVGCRKPIVLPSIKNYVDGKAGTKNRHPKVPFIAPSALRAERRQALQNTPKHADPDDKGDNFDINDEKTLMDSEQLARSSAFASSEAAVEGYEVSSPDREQTADEHTAKHILIAAVAEDKSPQPDTVEDIIAHNSSFNKEQLSPDTDPAVSADNEIVNQLSHSDDGPKKPSMQPHIAA